jgi:hypothetical protein
MRTARRPAWSVLVVAALATDVAMAQAIPPIVVPPLESGDTKHLHPDMARIPMPGMPPTGAVPRMHEDIRTLHREQCLSLMFDIGNVEHMNALLRQKAQLLETGATPPPVPPAGAPSRDAMAAVCDAPSVDLLAKLADQDNADRNLNTLLAQKVALLEKQGKTARNAPGQ